MGWGIQRCSQNLRPERGADTELALPPKKFLFFNSISASNASLKVIKASKSCFAQPQQPLAPKKSAPKITSPCPVRHPQVPSRPSQQSCHLPSMSPTPKAQCQPWKIRFYLPKSAQLCSGPSWGSSSHPALNSHRIPEEFQHWDVPGSHGESDKILSQLGDISTSPVQGLSLAQTQRVWRGITEIKRGKIPKIPPSHLEWMS